MSSTEGMEEEVEGEAEEVVVEEEKEVVVMEAEVEVHLPEEPTTGFWSLVSDLHSFIHSFKKTFY